MERIKISKNISHIIVTQPTTNKSRSSYLMLIKKLKEISDDPDWMIDLKKWIKFRKDFLIDNKINNKLICTYCGRDDLEEGYHDFNKINLNHYNSKLATIDHIYPISKGGLRYSEKNCTVSCKCNNQKADKIL